MVKEQYKAIDAALKVSKVSFDVQAGSEITNQAQMQCVNTNLHSKDAKGVTQGTAYGVLDPRLGAQKGKGSCATCGQEYLKCMGHFGFIDLQLPVYNIGFRKLIAQILQTICKTCSRVLLSEADRETFSRKIRHSTPSVHGKRLLFKEITKKCKTVSVCPHCCSLNGQVMNSGLLHVAHRKFKFAKKNEPKVMEELQKYAGLVEVKEGMGRDLEVLMDPNTVKTLFGHIPIQDYQFLLLDPSRASPTDLLVHRVAVPPTAIRPSVDSLLLSCTTEDDLTMELLKMIQANGVLEVLKPAKNNYQKMLAEWEILQAHYSLYINSDVTKNLPPDLVSSKDKKSPKGLVQRLKGKKGRFRGNLSGKRVDFTGRTVISPNPHLRINEVGIPELMAKKLTFPETVGEFNLKRLQQLVRNGPKQWPGANIIQFQSGGNKKDLNFLDRERAAGQLRVGDTVERHLCDGDVVLFNRQPSLHKLSLMAHRARVLPWRTLRFNESVCTPYNADFDGDEMNIHLPQTQEARAEALILMESKANMVTPRNGEMVIGAIQDFITGSYFLTHKDTVFTRDEAMTVLGPLFQTYGEDNMRLVLPTPHILKPGPLWSGKQLFSYVIRPRESSPVKINLDTRVKLYKGCKQELCPDDGHVIIRNSELLSGFLDKSLLGAGTKKGVFYLILRDYGTSEAAADAMWRLCKMMAAYLSTAGFSIGIGDVTPGPDIVADKQSLLEEGYRECDRHLKNYQENKLERQPGCTPEEALENLLLKRLSDIRESAGNTCLDKLPRTNSPLIMSICGSKGSPLNISQMIACVGQQALSGHRVPDGFINRTLPHFPPFTKSPEAKGFVENSFYSGLRPTEFFFHTMGGREGLVDTAVKTAETGYMQRRLVKAMEDLCCNYDDSVRSGAGELLQTRFGDDGLNPEFMEHDSALVDYSRLIHTARSLHPCRHEPAMSKDQILTLAQDTLSSQQFQECLNPGSEKEIEEFLKDYADKVEASLKSREEYLSGFPEKREDLEKVINEIHRLTPSQLGHFFSMYRSKYLKAKLEPGTAIGAICAQSIGEPATQMTLKTFHFAGVASMNITQGVPRIQEIINANKNISTPFISGTLEEEVKASKVKARIEKTLLGEVASSSTIKISSEQIYIMISLDTDRIRKLSLDVTASGVKDRIKRSIRGVDNSDIDIINNSTLAVRPPGKHVDKHGALASVLDLRSQLKSVVVQGIPTISRAVLHRSERGAGGECKVEIEGEGLQSVLGTAGLAGERTRSNNVLEVAEVLGIEAARATIVHEIHKTMDSHGIGVDQRHLVLLADLMTSTGVVLGVTRFGMAKYKQSTLMLASFEQTADHLFDAAYYSQTGPATGVTESILLGNPMKIGTGFFKLLHQYDRPALRPHRISLIPENNFHRRMF